eukprot:2804318-Amphidinium_carterae.1
MTALYLPIERSISIKFSTLCLSFAISFFNLVSEDHKNVKNQEAEIPDWHKTTSAQNCTANETRKNRPVHIPDMEDPKPPKVWSLWRSNWFGTLEVSGARK